MKQVYPFIAGAFIFCLASCTNLSSFENAYLRVQAGRDEPIEAYNRGQECYGSISPLVTVPKYPMRLLGDSSYDEYLTCYTAVTCAIDHGAYAKLKTQHIRTPEQYQALARELRLLQKSPTVSAEGKARIQSELALLSAMGGAAPVAAAAAVPPASAKVQPAAPKEQAVAKPVQNPATKAKLEAERKAKAKQEAAAKAKQEAAREAKQEADRKAKAKQDAARKAKLEAAKKNTQKKQETPETKESDFWDSMPEWKKNWYKNR